MCYTGKCKYEDSDGECILPWGMAIADTPDDAYCMRMEQEQDGAARTEAAEELAVLGP